jgi:hypothetical protein
MAASFPKAAVPDSFGVNTSGVNLTDKDFAKLKALKVRWARRGILWTQVEKTKGEYDFTAADKLVDGLEKHGIGLFCPVAFGNPLYEPGQHWMGVRTAAGREGYANYAAALVGRYKGKKIIYEIWNEANSGFWKPKADANQYMDMVDAAVPKMRAADPDCTIVAPSLYYIGWPKAIRWLEVCLKRGLHKKVDGISFHSYGSRAANAAVEKNIAWHANLRKLLAKYGAPADYPIVQSEYGINLQSHEFSGATAHREKQQARAVTRMYLVTLMLKMPVNIHYEWKTREKDKSKGLLNADGTVTAAYEAFKVLVARLDGYAFEKRLAGYADDDYLLAFKDAAGKTMLAAWTTGKEHKVEVPVAGTEVVDVWDMAGAKTTAKVADGKVTIELGPGPRYCGLRKGSLPAAAPGPPLTPRKRGQAAAGS